MRKFNIILFLNIFVILILNLGVQYLKRHLNLLEGVSNEQLLLGTLVLMLTITCFLFILLKSETIKHFRSSEFIQVPSHVDFIVNNLSNRAGIKPPKVLVYKDIDLNAFALGSKNKGYIKLTDSLINKLSTDELEGVIAHEISHLKHGDVSVMFFLSHYANAYVIVVGFLAGLLLYQNFSVKLSVESIIGLVVFRFLLKIFNSLILKRYSRSREFAADSFAKKITGSGLIVANVLVKIHYNIEGDLSLSQIESITSKEQGSFKDLVATHASVRSRVLNLLKF